MAKTQASAMAARTPNTPVLIRLARASRWRAGQVVAPKLQYIIRIRPRTGTANKNSVQKY